MHNNASQDAVTVCDGFIINEEVADKIFSKSIITF